MFEELRINARVKTFTPKNDKHQEKNHRRACRKIDQNLSTYITVMFNETYVFLDNSETQDEKSHNCRDP
jgi:hypothetical protein